jgi:hypothetical protein
MASLAEAGMMSSGGDRSQMVAAAGKLYFGAVNRNARTVVLALVAATTGCRSTAGPAGLAVVVTPGSRGVSVHEDSVRSVLADSVLVTLRGAGSGAASWSASHGSADWLTLVTAAGPGGAAVRWVVDPTQLPPGTYVDTITVAVAGASPVLVLDTLEVRGVPAELIALSRPWLPGEQATAIAAALRNHTPMPYVGDLADLAPQFLGGDSVTEIVANPAYAASASSTPAAQFSAGWGAVGVELFIENRSAVPWDTLAWLGVMWWNPADSTWKGWTIAATRANTVKLTTVSTSAFDASGATVGAGGGEAQIATGTYWEANGGQIQISKNNGCSRAVTLTSGVWLGGTSRTCKFGGRLVRLTMPRRAGNSAPATQSVDFDFRKAPIPGSRIVCVFPSPCTGAAAAAAVREFRAAGQPVPRSHR